MIGQDRNVDRAIAQRRHRDGHHVQAIQQIVAKTFFGGRDLQIRIRRRDHPRVHLNGLRTAHSLDLAFLQNAQQFGLDLHRNLSDFVQQNGAAMRLLEAPHPIVHRASERSLGVPKQFGFDQIFRNRRAVDRNQFGPGALARHVDRASHHFFSDAGFAGDQNRRLARAHQPDHGVQIANRAAFADQHLPPRLGDRDRGKFETFARHGDRAAQFLRGQRIGEVHERRHGRFDQRFVQRL